MKRVTILALVFLLAGCATGHLPAPLPQATADSAIFVVIRQAGFIGGGRSWPIAIDGHVIGDLGNGEHVVVPVEPGEHMVRLAVSCLGCADIAASAQASAGQAYYFETAMNDGFFTLTRIVTRLDEIRGRELVAKTKRLE